MTVSIASDWGCVWSSLVWICSRANEMPTMTVSIAADRGCVWSLLVWICSRANKMPTMTVSVASDRGWVWSLLVWICSSHSLCWLLYVSSLNLLPPLLLSVKSRCGSFDLQQLFWLSFCGPLCLGFTPTTTPPTSAMCVTSVICRWSLRCRSRSNPLSSWWLCCLLPAKNCCLDRYRWVLALSWRMRDTRILYDMKMCTGIGLGDVPIILTNCTLQLQVQLKVIVDNLTCANLFCEV